ncbi:MAG TPA: zinc ribbon domain-containing protein [Conexivisphaerales archaeon]|nr:zinc ribbon domain-containing protein [Conexivisphaerales archaeon]
MSQDEAGKAGPIRCPKCGFMNGPGIKFCGNCGADLKVSLRTNYVEALAASHLTASVYVLLTLAFNYRAFSSIPLLLSLYALAGIAGLYIGLQFHRGLGGLWLKVASAITIAIGLAGTLLLFFLSISLNWLTSPSWVLFVACGVLLFLSRKSL